jgi:hypothetical protein
LTKPLLLIALGQIKNGDARMVSIRGMIDWLVEPQNSRLSFTVASLDCGGDQILTQHTDSPGQKRVIDFF